MVRVTRQLPKSPRDCIIVSLARRKGIVTMEKGQGFLPTINELDKLADRGLSVITALLKLPKFDPNMKNSQGWTILLVCLGLVG